MAKRDYYDSFETNLETTCNNFNSSMDQNANIIAETGAKSFPADCPLNRIYLGRNAWSLLHTIASNYPIRPTGEEQTNMESFINIFSRLYPCRNCAEHLRERIKVSPPLVASRKELEDWLCWTHNDVNRRLGKPEFDCEQANERWKTGWADGSCNEID